MPAAKKLPTRRNALTGACGLLLILCLTQSPNGQAEDQQIALPRPASGEAQSCLPYQHGQSTAAQLVGSCGENQLLVARAVLGGAVLFQFNSNELNKAGLAAMDKLIQDLSGFREIQSIDIVGHTDTTGPAAFNLYLSELRARYIGDIFQAAFPTVTVTTSGRGESEPLNAEDTWSGRYRNRRVEIQVTALQ